MRRDSTTHDRSSEGARPLHRRIELSRRTFLRATGTAGAVGALGVGGIGEVGAVPTTPGDITKQAALDSIDYDLEHPRVFQTSTEVELARKNVENTAWGRELLSNLLAVADNMPLETDDHIGETAFPLPDDARPFADLTPEKLYEMAPIPTAEGEFLWAFPFHGNNATVGRGTACPIDGTPLTMSSFDARGEVVCDAGHVFPGTHDGIEITDDGSGWVVPEGVPDDWAAADHVGERFYFTAVYNGRVMRMIRSTNMAMAYAYLLTEEEAYAEMVAAMLDIAATTCHRSGPVVDGGMELARWYRSMYTVDTIANKFVTSTDLIWNSAAFDRDSELNADTPLAEHVAENLVVDVADFMWRDMHGGIEGQSHANYARIFHNGTDRYNRTLMICSSLLGLNAGYTEWVLDGQVSLRNFLANTVFRDGQYYEMSSLYAESFRQTAETAYLLENETYPDGVNVFDNARYQLLNVYGPRLRSVAGRDVKFGDGPPDFAVSPDPEAGDFGLVLRFYGYATRQADREEYAQILAEIAGGDPNSRLADIDVQYYNLDGAVWPLFNLDAAISGYDLAEIDPEPRNSELLPGRGFAHFRPESGFDRGAAMRYGPPLSKAHADQLGLHVFGAGRDMSYDPGHNPERHQRNGFLRQTVAHNTVVVNEWSQVPPDAAGGVVNLFADREGYSVADVADETAYAHEDVDTYRRTTAFVDVGEEDSYLVDLFRIAGAETADFAFHGLGVNFDTDLDLGAPAVGSVASEDYCWSEMRASGEIPEFENENDGFNPPPGNGYGFLCSPRSASGDSQWSATWAVDGDQGPFDENQGPVGAGPDPGMMRLTMLGDDGREVTVADGPDVLVENMDLDPEEHSVTYALARNEGPDPTQFTSVIEATDGEFVVDGVEALRTAGGDGAFEPTALAVRVDAETTDYVLSSADGDEFVTRESPPKFRTDAAFAMVRIDEQGVRSVRMEAGSRLKVTRRGRSLKIDAPESEYAGEIVAVGHEGPSLLVDADLPTGEHLDGRYGMVEAPEYSRNSQYAIERVEHVDGNARVELSDTDTTLSRGTVGAVEGDVLVSPTDFPFTWTRHYYVEGERGNEYFNGRLTLRNEDSGARTTVTDTNGGRRLTVADASGFDPGDTFVVLDIKAGDEFRVPNSVEIRREDGSYSVDAAANVETNAR